MKLTSAGAGEALGMVWAAYDWFSGMHNHAAPTNMTTNMTTNMSVHSLHAACMHRLACC